VAAIRWARACAALFMAGALLFSLPAGAQAGADPAVPPPGLDVFYRGVAQYRNGNYASALYLFQMARAAGNPSPNLTYNIALTLYQLGRDDEAERAFEDLSYEPGYRDIAEYHLGLIAVRTGNREAAASSLRRAAEDSDQEPLRRLAAAALAGLDGVLPRPDPAVYLSLGAGYDTNAGYQSDELQELSDTAGSFMEGIAALDQPLDGGVFAMGTVYAREYEAFAEHSQQAAQLALRLQRGGMNWQAAVTARGEGTWLGGEALHEAGTLALEGRRAAGSGHWTLRAASTRFTAKDIYAELEGWRHRAGIEYAASRAALGYEFEVNERADLEADSTFASRSPLRHTVSARTARALAERTTLEWRGRWRYSHYADPDRFNGTEERRRDTLLEAGLGARWRLSRLWSVLLEARYGRNRSSLDHYGYRRGSGVFSVEMVL
jgi:hypothetical protein